MIAFEVSLNGKRICTAGVHDLGVLSAILTWVRRRPAHGRDRTTIEEELTAEAGGLHHDSAGRGEHLRWVHRALKVGDRVAVRVIDTTRLDEPAERYRSEPPAAVAKVKRRSRGAAGPAAPRRGR